MTPSLNSFMSTLLADRGLQLNRVTLVVDNAVQHEASQNASPNQPMRKAHPSVRAPSTMPSPTSVASFKKSSLWESAPSGDEALDCLVWSQLCLRMSPTETSQCCISRSWPSKTNELKCTRCLQIICKEAQKSPL
jgi:hypothetical protein